MGLRLRKPSLFSFLRKKKRKGEEQFSGSKNFNRRCKNYGQNKRTGAKRIREIGQLAEVIYSDVDRKIMHTCYADTLVFQKVDSSTRRLAAIRFGGYPEQVRAISDAIYGGGSITARVESHEIILDTISKKYVRSLSHDGVYAESVLYSIDDEAKDWCDESAEERKEKEKKKMYIFCREGDTDSLFEEFDKKTSIPMIPEFKEYILEECIKRQILIPMEVLSRSIRFDAYVMEVSQNETEIEQVVNDGLASGRIAIPNATNDDEIKKLKNVSEYADEIGFADTKNKEGTNQSNTDTAQETKSGDFSFNMSNPMGDFGFTEMSDNDNDLPF